MPVGPALTAIAQLGGGLLQGLFGGDQERKAFSGRLRTPNLLGRSVDFADELRAVLSGLEPLDFDLARAPLPADPGGRVATPPRRRPLASAGAGGGLPPLLQRHEAGLDLPGRRPNPANPDGVRDPERQARRRGGSSATASAIDLLRSLG